MNLQLLANSNIKLPSHLSHIPVDYGYSNYSNKLNNYTTKNSFAAKKFASLDNVVNRFYPIKELDKKVINQVAAIAQFIDNNLPEDFTKNLKIQINVNSHLNDKFLKMGALMFSESSPLMRGVSPNISYMYPGTQQIVIGTKEYYIKPLGKINTKTKLNIISYLHVTNSSVETAVEFTLLHELSHTLEQYNKNKYGSLEDKIHETYKVIKHLTDNMEKKRIHNVQGITPNDFNINNILVSELNTLFGEIYADCGAMLLKRNYEILNKSYDKTNYDKYLDMVIDSRVKEKIIEEKLIKPLICSHDSSAGLSYLKKQLNSYPEQVLSLKTIHIISEKSVSHAITKKLEDILEHKNSIETLFNLRFENDEIKVGKYLDDTLSRHSKKVRII